MFKGLLAAAAVATVLAISPVASSGAQAQGMDGMSHREMMMHRMERMRMHRMMERRMMKKRRMMMHHHHDM